MTRHGSRPRTIKDSGSRLLGLWFLAGLFIHCSDDNNGPLVRLHLSMVDAAVSQAVLTVTATDPAGQSELLPQKQFNSGPFDVLGVLFPVGTRGATTYQVNLYDPASCLLAAGTAALPVDSDGSFDLSLATAPTPMCGNGATLTVQVANHGTTGVVTSTPSGINCQGTGSGCSAIFPKGTPISLSGQTASGSFVNWFGVDCAGTADCAFTLAQDTQVQAEFSNCHGWCKEQLPTNITANLNGIAGTAANNILVVGDNGTALQWSGTGWQQLSPPSGSSVALRAATARLGGTTIYVAGDSGTVLTFAGLKWSPFTAVTTANLRATGIGFGSNPNIYFVGDSGAAVVLANGSISLSANFKNNVSVNVYGISQNPSGFRDDLYFGGAVSGGKGLAESWDGGGFFTAQMSTGVNIPGNINAMLCGSTVYFAVGDGGMVVSRSNGFGQNNAWQLAAAGLTPQNLRGIWQSAANNVLVVGDGGTILQYDGTSWIKVTSGTTTNLHAIWGTSASNVYAVGDAGTILHYLP